MHHTNISKARNRKLPLRTFGTFAIILLLAVSVTWWLTHNYYNHSEATDRAFLRLDSSLSMANQFLTNACSEDSIYASSKSRQPGFEKILITYKPKIDSVMRITRGMHNYMQAIRLSLISNTDAKDRNGQEGNSPVIARTKLISNEIVKGLYDSLNAYSHSLLNIFPFKIQNYNFTTPVDTSNPFSKNVAVWRKNYFDGLTGPAILSSLTELDYQVWLSASKMTNIIRSQWSEDLIGNFTIYLPFVNQNSMYFLPGQTLKISAGLGKYSNDIKPDITIDGQPQLLDANGIAEYNKVVTVGKSSSIPVSISYRSPNTGELLSMSKSIIYTVLQPAKK